MDAFIARENIRHFSSLLAGETDEPKRRILLGLLATEKERLAIAEAAETLSEKGDSTLTGPSHDDSD